MSIQREKIQLRDDSFEIVSNQIWNNALQTYFPQDIVGLINREKHIGGIVSKGIAVESNCISRTESERVERWGISQEDRMELFFAKLIRDAALVLRGRGMPRYVGWIIDLLNRGSYKIEPHILMSRLVPQYQVTQGFKKSEDSTWRLYARLRAEFSIRLDNADEDMDGKRLRVMDHVTRRLRADADAERAKLELLMQDVERKQRQIVANNARIQRQYEKRLAREAMRETLSRLQIAMQQNPRISRLEVQKDFGINVSDREVQKEIDKIGKRKFGELFISNHERLMHERLRDLYDLLSLSTPAEKIIENIGVQTETIRHHIKLLSRHVPYEIGFTVAEASVRGLDPGRPCITMQQRKEMIERFKEML